MSLEFSPTREKNAGRVSDIARVLISDVELAEILGCSRTTVWRRVADNTLPKPIKLGGLTRFVLTEISATIETAMVARNGKAARAMAQKWLNPAGEGGVRCASDWRHNPDYSTSFCGI